jgi:electron transport complex protein RnfG
MNEAMREKPIMLIVVLGLVSIIAAAALGLVYGVTKVRIQGEEQKAKQEALRDVLPRAVRFDEIKTQYDVAGEPFAYYEAYDADGALVGYAFEGRAPGYSSTIELTVGLSPDEQTMTGIKITKQQETPGLGAVCVKGGATKNIWEIFSQAQAGANDRGWQGQFTKMTLEQLGDQGIPKNVRALSGATITTNAVLRAMRSAVRNYHTARGRDPRVTISGPTRKAGTQPPENAQEANAQGANAQ